MTKDGGGKHQTSTSGALHNDTAYGLIEPGKNGNWKVVSRSALTSFMTAVWQAVQGIQARRQRFRG